jgi:transposase-like protein
MSRFEQSGLSVSQFCEGEGIGEASFYQWRRRLSSADAGQRSRSQVPEPLPASGGDFLHLGRLGGEASRLQVRVELGGGVVVHVTRG